MTALVIALCYIFTVTGLMRMGVVSDDFVGFGARVAISFAGVAGAIWEGVRTFNSETPRPRTDNEHDQTTEETES